MPIDRDPKYLHPLLRMQAQALLTAIGNALPTGMTARVISLHRTPAEQFELFKKGRVFQGGKWVGKKRQKKGPWSIFS